MIYFVQRADGAIKIGKAWRFEPRFKTLCKQYGALDVLGVAVGNYTTEHNLHLYFESDQLRDGSNEWFQQSDRIMEYIGRWTTLDIGLCFQSERHLSSQVVGLHSDLRERLGLSGKRFFYPEMKTVGEQLNINTNLIWRWIEGHVGTERPPFAASLCGRLGCKLEDIFYYVKVRDQKRIEPERIPYLVGR